jgi:hypothetical protein
LTYEDLCGKTSDVNVALSCRGFFVCRETLRDDLGNDIPILDELALLWLPRSYVCPVVPGAAGGNSHFDIR